MILPPLQRIIWEHRGPVGRGAVGISEPGLQEVTVTISTNKI